MEVNVNEAYEAIQCLEFDKPKLEEKIETILRNKDKEVEILEERIDDEMASKKEISKLLQKSIEAQETSWFDSPILWFVAGAAVTFVTVLVAN